MYCVISVCLSRREALPPTFRRRTGLGPAASTRAHTGHAASYPVQAREGVSKRLFNANRIRRLRFASAAEPTSSSLHIQVALCQLSVGADKAANITTARTARARTVPPHPYAPAQTHM